LNCPLPLDIAGCCCYGVCMVELINQNQFLTTMTNEFIKSFVSTLMYNVATLVAVIVGVALFVANSVSNWYNNGGRETLLKYTQQFLLFVSSSTEKAYYWACDVTETELAH
jgi:hypothetical protein